MERYHLQELKKVPQEQVEKQLELRLQLRPCKPLKWPKYRKQSTAW